MNAPWTPPAVVGGGYTADDMRAYAAQQIEVGLLLGTLQRPVAPAGCTCGDCRFYHRQETELLGECHRRAPQVDRQRRPVFPLLSATDGCGDGEETV